MSSGMLDVAFKSLAQIKKELTKVAQRTIKENSHIIIDMNTDTLMQGLDSDGDRLEPEYRNEDYADEKSRMNSRPGYGTPDLFYTGRFQRGFFVKVQKEIWELGSKDSKSSLLSNKYGKDIFGNTKIDEKEINDEYVTADLIEYTLDNIDL